MRYEEMLNYRGVIQKPETFDLFWKEAVEASRADGDIYYLKPVESQEEGIECFHLTFMGVENAKIFCLFARPASAAMPLPGVCFFHGYCGSRPNVSAEKDFEELLPFARAGFAVIGMKVRGQWKESEDPHRNFGFEFPHLFLKGILSGKKEDSYCRGIYTDAAKCARILMKIDGVDSARVSVVGFSQGGDLCAACAALEPKIYRIIMGGIGFADCGRHVRERRFAYASAAFAVSFQQYFAQCDPECITQEKLIYGMAIYDLLLFAPKISAPVIYCVGLQDNICPFAGQMAVYNRLECSKQLVIWHEGVHRLHPEFLGDMPKILKADDFCYQENGIQTFDSIVHR